MEAKLRKGQTTECVTRRNSIVRVTLGFMCLGFLGLMGCQSVPEREMETKTDLAEKRLEVSKKYTGCIRHGGKALKGETTTSSIPLTSIIVRPQAHGGKFIGDDIGGALITIKDAQTGTLLAEGLTQGGSGEIQPDYGIDASLTAIVTPGQKPEWVHAVTGTSEFCANLPLQRPTLLEISALGPLAGLQNAHRSTVLEWVTPGQNLASDVGVVVVIPGLLVQVLSPSTHTKFAGDSKLIDFAANVTMMCGCPIDEAGPWPYSDFVVTAFVRNLSQNILHAFELTFSGTTSLFTGQAEITGKGDYLVTIEAQQISIRNGGVGQVSFILTGS